MIRAPRSRPRWILSLVTVGALLMVRTGAPGLKGASNQSSDLPSHVHHRPGSIIGAETPERIPTDVAISLLFRTIHQASDDAPAPHRLAAYFDKIETISGGRLVPSDRMALLSASQAYVVSTRVASPAYPSGMAPEHFSRRRGEIATQLWQGLDQSLTSSAKRSLQRYLDGYMKSTIKILK